MGLRHSRQQAPGAAPCGRATPGDGRGRCRRTGGGRDVPAGAGRGADGHRAAGVRTACHVARTAGRDPSAAGRSRPLRRGDRRRPPHDPRCGPCCPAPGLVPVARLARPGCAAMTTRDYDDFAAIAADEALLHALGAEDFDLGDPDLTASDDALADLLAGWRRELDAAVTAPPARGTAVVVPSTGADPATDDETGQSSWLRRHLAPVAAASVLVLAGSTGVAAAQSGRSGPLAAVHRVLWGAPAPDDNALLAQISTLLDGVTVDLDNARAQGGATAAGISDMSDRLDHAGRLLAGDPAAPDALTARLVELRADLAALDTVPTSPPAVGTANGGQTAPFPGESGSPGPGEGPAGGGAPRGAARALGRTGARSAGVGTGPALPPPARPRQWRPDGPLPRRVRLARLGEGAVG